MQVKEEKGVEDAYYKSKEAAMENFRNRWGDNAYLLDSLNENPLPNSVVVMMNLTLSMKQQNIWSEKAVLC